MVRVTILSFLFTAFLACVKPEVNKVVTNGRTIELNGEPYLIKGVCYHPVPKGSLERSFENLAADLELIKDAGINTVRIYSPVDDIKVLDTFNNAGVKIIVGFGYNQQKYFDILSGPFIDYIKKYKINQNLVFSH